MQIALLQPQWEDVSDFENMVNNENVTKIMSVASDGLSELLAEQVDNFSEEEAKEENNGDYASMTVSELRKLAKEAGVNGYSTMKKDELISSLN